MSAQGACTRIENPGRDLCALECARLGQECRFSGRLSEAEAYLRRAHEIEPQRIEYLANLGNVLILLGRIEEGVRLCRQAHLAAPESPEAHSNYLCALHYLPSQDRHSLFLEHRRWGRLHADLRWARQHTPAQDPDRRIRVGYVSADFRGHSVAYTFEPFLSSRDREGFEVFGYSNARSHDRITEYLLPKFDHFKCVGAVDDRALADQIALSPNGHRMGQPLKDKFTRALGVWSIRWTWLVIRQHGTSTARGQPLKDKFTRAPGSLEHQVDVIGHQTARQQADLEGIYALGQEPEEPQAVCVVIEDLLRFIASQRNVVDTVFQQQSLEAEPWPDSITTARTRQSQFSF